MGQDNRRTVALEFCHSRYSGFGGLVPHGVVLDVSAPQTRTVLQLPACGDKGIPDRDIDVLVIRLFLRLLPPLSDFRLRSAAVEGRNMIDDDIRVGHAKVQGHPVFSPVAGMRRFNNGVATRNAVKIPC
jgi:hypothetical protein